jgi:multidrug resistance efflux pump
VELLVSQFENVQAGTPLYRIDSSRWREMQKELADAHAAVRLAEASAESITPLFEAHEEHHTEIQKAVDLWTARTAALEQLQSAGGAGGDEVAAARASLASARSDLAETLEKEAELGARQKETAAALEAARSRLRFLFEASATLTGIPSAELQAVDSNASARQPRPRWTTLGAIEVRALAPGVVETLSTVCGGVVDEHDPVVVTVQPALVRFRAVGLQSDLPRLADGQPASVVAAQRDSLSSGAQALSGTLTLAPTADHERRTVDLLLTPAPSPGAGTLPTWARAGVAAFLEVVTSVGSGDGGAELAIPLRSVARDGTQAIIFRRDPSNPDKAIRVEADLGIDDGRWVVIKSGVAEGDDVVLEGVYQLMVATSGSVTKGGHFHPDGTFHDGDE